MKDKKKLQILKLPTLVELRVNMFFNWICTVMCIPVYFDMGMVSLHSDSVFYI